MEKIILDISASECLRHFITSSGISSRDDLRLPIHYRVKGCFWTVELLDRNFMQIVVVEH
jgi:hypothetical protein